MNPLVKFFRKLFFKPATFGECLRSVISKFKVGECINRAPGQRVFKIKNSDNILKVTANINDKFRQGSLDISVLFPTNMPYEEYCKMVGKPAGINSTRLLWVPKKSIETRSFPEVSAVSSERYANKTGLGGLSSEYVFADRKYFIPSKSCARGGLTERYRCFDVK